MKDIMDKGNITLENREISKVLERIGKLLELKIDDIFNTNHLGKIFKGLNK